MLYAATPVEIVINDAAKLGKKVTNPLQTVLAGQPYYGAAALSPDDGLMSDATIFVGNYFDVEHASTEALAQCDAKKTGKAPCVIAATVRPKGWVQKAVQLSPDATAGFLKDYPKTGGALAISPSKAIWTIGDKSKSALAECAKKSKAKDCVVVIAN